VLWRVGFCGGEICLQGYGPVILKAKKEKWLEMKLQARFRAEVGAGFKTRNDLVRNYSRENEASISGHIVRSRHFSSCFQGFNMMRLLPLLFLSLGWAFLLVTFFRTGFSTPYQDIHDRIGSPNKRLTASPCSGSWLIQEHRSNTMYDSAISNSSNQHVRKPRDPHRLLFETRATIGSDHTRI